MYKPCSFVSIVTLVAALSPSAVFAQANPSALSRRSTVPATSAAIGERKTSFADKTGKSASYTFDSAFHALSEQAQATILAEGRPLNFTLSENDFNALKAQLANANDLSVSDAIAKTAEAYDYTAEKVNAHLYLLHKRYSDLHDLPCVTYEELMNSLRQMERLCNQYGSHTATPNSSYTLPELAFQSLTPEQVKKAETGITLGELTAEQQQLARTAAMEIGIGGKIISLHQTIHHLAALESPRTVFKYGYSLTKVAAFVYSGPFDYESKIYDFPIDNRFTVHSGGYSRAAWVVPVMPKTPEEEDKAWGPDRTLPTEEDRRVLREAQADTSPYRTTLGALAEALSKPANANTSGAVTPASIDMPSDQKIPTHFTVEAGLSRKTVSVYGLKNSTVDSVVRSLASLYQLTLLVPSARRYAIILSPASDRADEGFNAKIRKLIPAPLQRAHDRQSALRGDEALKRRKDPNFPEALLRQGARSETAEVYYFPADHRLLLLAKPVVPKRESPPVPLSKADPDVYRLIGLMI